VPLGDPELDSQRNDRPARRAEHDDQQRPVTPDQMTAIDAERP
jgi:hypothetical protein